MRIRMVSFIKRSKDGGQSNFGGHTLIVMKEGEGALSASTADDDSVYTVDETNVECYVTSRVSPPPPPPRSAQANRRLDDDGSSEGDESTASIQLGVSVGIVYAIAKAFIDPVTATFENFFRGVPTNKDFKEKSNDCSSEATGYATDLNSCDSAYDVSRPKEVKLVNLPATIEQEKITEDDVYSDESSSSSTEVKECRKRENTADENDSNDGSSVSSFFSAPSAGSTENEFNDEISMDASTMQWNEEQIDDEDETRVDTDDATTVDSDKLSRDMR